MIEALLIGLPCGRSPDVSADTMPNSWGASRPVAPRSPPESDAGNGRDRDTRRLASCDCPMRTTTASRRRALARLGLVPVLVCAAAACSSGSSSGKSPAVTTTQPASTAPPTTVRAGGTAVKGDAFCKAATAGFRAENSVDLENGSPASLRRTAAAAIVAAKAAQKLAPDDAQALMATLVKRLGDFQRVLAANNYDVAAFKASTAGQQLLNDPALGQTFESLNAYLETKCGTSQ
jgi:hypothetical protein